MTKIKQNTFYTQVRKVNKSLCKESIEFVYYTLSENNSSVLDKSYKANRGEYVGRNYYEVSDEQLKEILVYGLNDIGYLTNLKSGKHLMVAF